MKKLLGVLAAGVLIGAGESGDDQGKKELEKLQGTWRYVSFEIDGNKMPEEKVKKITITCNGEKWVIREGDKVSTAGTHKLDATKEPHEIDWVFTQGEARGATLRGIYEFKGDTIRLCFSDPQGKERPKSFTAGPGQFVAVIRREKK
jgi:uncharacterized protein (TIGR03067 family)